MTCFVFLKICVEGKEFRAANTALKRDLLLSDRIHEDFVVLVLLNAQRLILFVDHRDVAVAVEEEVDELVGHVHVGEAVDEAEDGGGAN